MQVKLILTGVTSFTIGALLAWAVTADAADAKLTQAEAEFDALREVVRKRQTAILELTHENFVLSTKLSRHEAPFPEPTNHVDEVVEEIEVVETPFEVYETVEETRSNLQDMISQYTSDNVPDVYFDRSSEVIVDNSAPPFVISQATYSWDADEGDEYNKVTVQFYPNQRILLDEDEDVVDDVEAYVGWKNLNRFGDESNDADIVYIRNRAMETDFEVERVEEELPLHIKYGMSKVAFETNRSAGRIKFREEDV